MATQRNVVRALRECARGKRGSRGYQLLQLNLAESLVGIAQQLATGSWSWRPYNSFMVCDPKKRKIFAAPFVDRVVHHAIHQVIAPFVEAQMPRNSWACRKGMGTRGAVLALASELGRLGPRRYVVKLDVANYFPSIDHSVLEPMLQAVLPDRTIDQLLGSLLRSHPEYRHNARGIPLGNLTSQLFANFYLSGVDRLCRDNADIFYIRYMDDMVLVGADKGAVLDLKDRVVAYCEQELNLTIPLRKTVHLAADPVPFLGYVIDPCGFRVLSRTKRRHRRQLQRMKRAGCRASDMAVVAQSVRAFASLDPGWSG